MSRNLSLSQAARLIGVTRKDIQKKIQENKLIVMEGTVLLEDLKKTYPDAEYEDNSMLEKTQKLMSDAVYKMSQSEHEGAQLDALSRRAFKLNQELVQEKARADYYEQLLNELRHKFVKLSTSNKDHKSIIKIQKWLIDAIDNDGQTQKAEQEALLSQQIEHYMQPHVRLLPSHHDFTSEPSQSLLESALYAGMAVDYGCNNGQCGKCKVKLVSGQIKSCKHSDYVFTAEEKSQNYILSCVNSAVNDVVLETAEAITVEDIPRQKVTTRVKSLQPIQDKTYILNLKTPRSQRLRFLAGQSIRLTLDDIIDKKTDAPISQSFNIASCPCDDRNIQFHLSQSSDSTFVQALIAKTNKISQITLEGPEGFFILDDTSPRPIIFIAENTGFGPIKSLTENALAVDMDKNIQLIWLANDDHNLYMNNLCRSWNDALDNFNYIPLLKDDNKSSLELGQVILGKIASQDSVNSFDYYISAYSETTLVLKDLLIANGCMQEQIHINIIEND